MDSQAINNVNQQQLIIPYYSTATGKRSELNARSKMRNGETVETPEKIVETHGGNMRKHF